MDTLYALVSKERLSRRLAELSQCLNIPTRLLNARGKPLEQHGPADSCCRLLKAGAFCEGNCMPVGCKTGEKACEPGESYVFCCPADLSYLVFPLAVHGTVLGTVLAGPFLAEAPDGVHLTERDHLPPSLCQELHAALKKLPVINAARVRSICGLMEDLFAPLLSEARLSVQERQGKLYQQSIINETVQHYQGNRTESMGRLIYHKECDLLSKVRQCDIRGARQVLNELLGFVLLAQGENLQWIRARACELTVLLSRIAIEGGATPDRILALNPRYLEQLQKDETYEDLCFSLKEIVENFVEAISLPAAAQARPVVRRAVEYIADHFDQPLSIQSLADELDINPSYFSAVFSRCMGMGFHEYLTRLRMEEARRLLSATRYPINQIAVTVGYADQSSFTKAFKRVMGITPYRLRG